MLFFRRFPIGVALLVMLPLAFTQLAQADISVIANAKSKGQLTERDLYNLYLGIEKTSTYELLHQGVDQVARAEFFEKFLHQNETQMKRKWSTLIFSGNRIPTVIEDNRSVLEYVKVHPDAVGYVTSAFLDKASVKPGDGIVELFRVR